MKILVTGSSGFIGRTFCKMFKDSFEIVPFDLVIGLDIKNTKQLEEKMKGCDAVLHLAAHTSLPKSWDDPSETYYNNLVGASNVFETAIKLGIQKVVYASSSSVYAATENPYACGKMAVDMIAKVRENELNTIGFRFFNVFGTGQNPDYGMVIPAFIGGIKNNGKVTIYGDGEQTRDFIHVEDVAKCLAIALVTHIPGANVFDLGTGKSYSINEIACLIAGILGKKVDITYEAPRKEAKHSKADTTLVEQLFGFKYTISLMTGIRRMLKEGL